MPGSAAFETTHRARLSSAAIRLAPLLIFGLGASPLLAQELTIERIASLPSLIGTEPSQPAWSPDSLHLAFLWNDHGMPFLDVWLVSTDSDKPKRITDLARDFAPPDSGDAGAVERAAARARGGVSDLAWFPDGSSLVLSYGGDLFRVGLDGTGLERWTRTGGPKSELAFSPDGRVLSFLEGGDLWIRDREKGYLVQATRVGRPPLGHVPGGRYHRPDVELTRPRWSPDGRFVALHYDDRRAVRKVPFPDYLGEETHVEWLRRDYPGDNDHIRAVALYAVEEGLVHLIDLPEATNRRISNFNWSPDGTHLLIDQNSEDGVHRWITIVRPDDRSTEEVWYDRGDRRVQQYYVSDWLSDGRGILFVGDLDERYRLYRLELPSRVPQALTEGEWDVVSERSTASLAVSWKTRHAFFQGSRKSPYERHVYRVSEDGGGVVQVTSLPGVHTPYLSPDGAKLAVLHSSDLSPPELYVLEAREGAIERRITRSPHEAFYGIEWARPRYVTFESRIDDYVLHGRLMEPPDLDRSKKYPVVLGPAYSNTARNQWRGRNATLQQFLAVEGRYLVMDVDIRGSTGYGRKFREEFLGDWGGGDIEDLHSAVEYLKTLPYVDPERIGIWGSSYGGTLTAFSLFKKPGVYRAGVAGAPAISVKHFTTGDVHISGRPETHPEVFHDASALSYGEQLRDPLLIIHGMQDDVVPFKTSVDLAEKLMLLGKDFDFAFAPTAVHGWSQKDYYAVYFFRKLVQYFDRHLGRGPRPADATTPANGSGPRQ